MQNNQQVLISQIRRVMPSIIANDIIGVQSMTGPIIDIHTMRTNYNWAGRVVLYKEHFNHFLRVYNRRKRHHPDYLTNLGYTRIRLDYSNSIPAARWCRENLKHGAYVRSSADFWFAYDKDATLFTLKWL